MSRRGAAVLALSLCISPVASSDDPVAAGREFAIATDGCGLDHGYRCVPVGEEDFTGLEADRRMLPGNWLRAWQVAQADFRATPDLPEEARALKHYKFGLAETADAYVVHFQPLLTPMVEDGEVTGIARASIGRQARYWIDKTDFSVARRQFYK